MPQNEPSKATLNYPTDVTEFLNWSPPKVGLTLQSLGRKKEREERKGRKRHKNNSATLLTFRASKGVVLTVLQIHDLKRINIFLKRLWQNNQVTSF